MDNKPKFKPENGIDYKISLESTTPFFEKVHPQWGPSYGYNVKIDGKEYVWFCKESPYRLFQAAGVQSNQEFNMALKSVKDNAGNVKTFWYLNGKTLWDYQDNPAHSPEPKVADVKPVEPVQVKADKTLEERVAALEARMDKCESSEDKIPF